MLFTKLASDSRRNHLVARDLTPSLVCPPTSGAPQKMRRVHGALAMRAILVALVFGGPLASTVLADDANSNVESASNDAPASDPDPATATQPSDDGDSDAHDPVRVERLFNMHWATFARWFQVFNDEYFLFSYDSRFPNSRLLTPEQAKDKMSTTRKVKVPGYNMLRDEKVYAPAGESDAFGYALPDLNQGTYGFIHSFVVDRVLGDEEIIVSQIWVFDRDQMRREREEYSRKLDSDQIRAGEADRPFKLRYKLQEQPERDNRWKHVRVKGFSTKGLALGTRWKGPRGKGVQVVILGYEKTKKNDGGNVVSLPVLVPVDVLKTGLTQAQFRDLLTKRGYTAEDFVTLVKTEYRSQGTKKAHPAILDQIQKGKEFTPPAP